MTPNKFKGQALNQIVVVEEIFHENKTKSGIDISGIVDANEKQKRGIIRSIGTECPRKPQSFFSRIFGGKNRYTIEVGSEVIFDKFKATAMTQNGNPYLLVFYRDLIWTGK